MKTDCFVYTDKGGKPHNEDFAAYKEKAGSGIYVVADGLGGYQHGDLAARCAVNSLLQTWDIWEVQERGDWLEAQIRAANQRVLQIQRDLRNTMRSTVVALAIDESRAVWVNVGDSRLYYIRQGKLVHMTEDHSLAYEKYRAGKLTKAQINEDKEQSILLRALGEAEWWKPDIYECSRIKSGDGFLLCSDGAWKYLCDEEILADFLAAKGAKEWTEQLLRRVAARARPGSDNLTVMTVLVG